MTEKPEPASAAEPPLTLSEFFPQKEYCGVTFHWSPGGLVTYLRKKGDVTWGGFSFIRGESSLIALLVWAYLAVLCTSLVLASLATRLAFHISYDGQHLVPAMISVAALSCFALLLARCEFSFGYVASFYFLTVISGYLWLSYFTPLEYDKNTSRWSAAASFLAFALPAILITKSPIRVPTLTPLQMDRLAIGLLVATALLLACGAYSGHQSHFPKWLNYALSISAGAMVPFAYAWFSLRKAYILASVALVISAAFYPITLTKTALLSPLWLIFLTLLLKVFRPRIAIVLSLFVPLLLGVLTFGLEPPDRKIIFGIINIRMLAVPASALDHYNHFFSTHALTHFCQVSLVGKMFNCALPDQLGVLLANEYGLGNYNASLFATEGIASVGLFLAPVAALFCGLVISIGNLASSGLRPSFVFLSSSLLIQAMTNIPLSVAMVTQGGIVIFLLWSITPRNGVARQSPL
jgi:hypothetical protein